MGHDVFASDVSPADLSGLDRPADVVFPVLHGAFGESGELQEILEDRGLLFVGSGSRASRLGMNKADTKVAWKRAGLPTPQWEVITRSDSSPTLAAPCVVKPLDSGSSLDVAICHDDDQIDAACALVLARHHEALVEELIEGPELTVGLLEEEPLDPIRIVVQRDFFDFAAKYQGCGTEHRFDLDLPESVSERCRELAAEANRVIGCRDLARVDMMLDADLEPYLLEINTMPGFTPTSLLPEAAAHRGISFGELVDRLVRRAADRIVAERPSVAVSIAPQPVRRGKLVAARKTA
jgi:D-alanine-D-alanine ligase